MRPLWNTPSLPKVALPVSDRLSTEVLSIPVFPKLPEAGRATTLAAIASFCAGG